MNLVDVGIKWRDRLPWYQRVALVVWWLGVTTCVLCVVLGAWLLLATDRSSSQQSGAAAATLVGIAALLVGRLAVALALRRRRGRFRKSYFG